MMNNRHARGPLLISVIASALLLGGCAGQASSSRAASTNSGQEKQAEADREAVAATMISAEPSTLDSARFLGITDRNILHNITEPLTRIENGQVTGAGAESWEVSEDGLKITFHLRDNEWDDGQKVTAGDYLASLKREADPVNAFSFASDFFTIKGFEEIYKGEAAMDTLGVKAEDDSTLVIELNNPNPAFLSSVDFFPIREEDAESYGDQYGLEAETMKSCGPFRLDEWAHNSELKFSRNENYWDAENTQLAGYTVSVITDEGARMAALQNGSVDYGTVSASEFAEQFASDPEMYEMEIPSDRTAMLVFNCEDDLFANEKIRQAFSLAIDRDQVTAVQADGLGKPAYGLVPSVSYVGDTNFRQAVSEPLLALKEENQDPQQLLLAGMAEAGLGDDPSALSVSLSWGSTSATARTNAELYQQMWKDALGVDVTVDFSESSTMRSNVMNGEYQIAAVAWGSTYEPYFQLSRWASPSGGQSRWKNEEFRKLVNGAQSEMDEAKRLQAYRQAEEMLVNQAAIAPTYYNMSRTFIRNAVHGIPDNPFDTTGMKTVWVEK